MSFPLIFIVNIYTFVQLLNIPSLSRCYTPTEFALFGIGAIVMGVMLGVVGISWFKHQV